MNSIYTKEQVDESFKRIGVGQLYEVSTDVFFTSGKDEYKKNGGRETRIKRGTIIEIRYPYERHFRTEDNFYFHAEPEVILENTVPLGQIREPIRFGNQAKLEEILRLKLYTEHPVYNEYRYAKLKEKDGF